MTAKEVLYDSETLLRLVDSEIEELRADLPSNGDVAISPLDPVPSSCDSEEQTEVGAELHRLRLCP